ncbi:MAG: chorismate mutase [Micrococcales bacterium]|nr:chorismate mutase [Micrococcales bacterium]
MALRAIRGAIQVPANTAGDIASGVQELIAAILKANELTPSEVISVFFTSTVDLDAAFPAAACREMGFANVPLIGSVEVDKTVRALLHVETERTPEQITHVYLHGAASLRRDIAQ